MIPGKVNIVIPLYNQEQYIGECMRSAMAQTYGNFDITVINDGSTDRSALVAREVVDEWNTTVRPNVCTIVDGAWDFWNRLKIVTQENKGLSESRNIGFRMGDGEFILPLDSDDWIDPTYLERTVPQMANPEVGIVSTDMQYEGLLHTRIPPKGLTLAHEMVSNDLPVCSLIRRAAFEQTKGYENIFVEIHGNTKVLGYEDWEMWIQILKRGWKVAVVNEPLFHYRVKPVSMITQATKMHTGLVKIVHLLHPDLWERP